MDIELIVFLILSALMLSSAVMVVVSRNLFHAGLYLMVSLFGVAGLFILLSAFFLGVVQVVIYIGAIAILILMAVMLTPNVTRMGDVFTPQWIIAAVVAAAFGIMLVTVVSPLMDEVLTVDEWRVQAFDVEIDDADEVSGDYLTTLGEDLVDPHKYMLPFEVASLLLMAALIGAVLLVNPGEVEDDEHAVSAESDEA